jgi:hypothetical protein
MFSALKFVLFNLFYTIPFTDVIFDIKTFNYQVILTFDTTYITYLTYLTYLTYFTVLLSGNVNCCYYLSFLSNLSYLSHLSYYQVMFTCMQKIIWHYIKTVKYALTITSVQRPTVNKDQNDSTTTSVYLIVYWAPLSNCHFFRSQGYLLGKGLTVIIINHLLISNAHISSL